MVEKLINMIKMEIMGYGRGDLNILDEAWVKGDLEELKAISDKEMAID